MAAPVFGSGYMEVSPPGAPNPANVVETISKLDPAFVTAYNSAKYLIPGGPEGDNAFIEAIALIATRYKTGSGVYNPTLSSILPTTGVHGTAVTPMTATGTNFDSSASVTFNGVPVTVLSVTATTITFNVAAGLTPIAGTYPVVVKNAAGTTPSAAVNFTAT